MIGIVAVIVLAAGAADASAPIGNWGTLYSGSKSSPNADSYGTSGETADLTSWFVDAEVKDDKADGNGAYELTEFEVKTSSGYQDDGDHQTADVGTADGRVDKYWSASLDSEYDQGRVATEVCVNLSLRPDICSLTALFTFSY